MRHESLEGRVLGKYRILQPLGQGGMARVFRAYHPQLDRYVALKILRTEIAGQQELLVRFQREAKAVASLRHPHIVQIFDFDTEGDLCYMVMEYVEGDTLRTRINDYRIRKERIPAGESVRILLDVLDGLDHAHHAGITHRDIKPANILLTMDGQAVLTDFGVAQTIGETRFTTPGALMGTLQYMSPEQGNARGDSRSDIYSLGIVLYEMLVGFPPFDADTPLAILMMHARDPLPPPREANPEIPEPMERILLRALAKNPEDRYQTPSEMAQDLLSVCRESGLTLPERISRPLSFTTQSASQESISVYSGKDRRKLGDIGFSKEKTDPALERALGISKTASADSHRAFRILMFILIPIFLALVYLTASLIVTAATDRADLLTAGWPVLLFALVLLLGLLSEERSSAWISFILPPLFLSASLIAIYVLSGLWEFWYAWLLEPLAFFLGVAGALLDRYARGSQQITRLARRTITILSVVFFCGIPIWIFLRGFGRY